MLMATTKKKLGELLREAGLIDEIQLKSALNYQEQWGGRLGSIIIKRGFVSEQDLVSVLEKQLGVKCTSLENIEKPSEDVLKMVKIDIAKKFVIFPIKFEKKSLILATSDPTDLKTIDDINFMLGLRVKPLLALESDIQLAISKYYEGTSGTGTTSSVDMDKVASRIARSMPTGVVPEIERTSQLLEKEPLRSTAKKEMPQKAVLESLIDLLIAKGIFSKEELLNTLKSRKQS